VHAEPCERFERADSVPEIVSHRLVSVRAYDADDMCIYDLGDVCDGGFWNVLWLTTAPITSTSIPRDRAAFCVGSSESERMLPQNS
jgi:hypothetical protein